MRLALALPLLLAACGGGYPAACGDAAALDLLARHHLHGPMQAGAPAMVAVEEVAGIAVQPSSAANRHCRGVAVLEGGRREPLYWAFPVASGFPVSAPKLWACAPGLGTDCARALPPEWGGVPR